MNLRSVVEIVMEYRWGQRFASSGGADVNVWRTGKLMEAIKDRSGNRDMKPCEDVSPLLVWW